MAAWRTLLTAHARLIDRIEAELKTAGAIPLTWYDVLIELWEAPERRLRLHELASAVLLSRSGITRLVDRLEAAGLLRREPDPADRRGAYAAITEAGQAALRFAWPVYGQGIDEHFARHLTDEQARVIAESLGPLAARAREPSAG
jgi:DNA-binding MarR family transcriptional regulator